MSAGSIVIDLLMRTGAFETDTKRAEKRLQDFQRSVARAGKVIGTAIAAGVTTAAVAIKSQIDKMDELSKAAQRVQMPTEEFSQLAYAGSLADVSINDLVGAMGRLAKAQAGPGDTFKRLGIEVQDAEGKLRSTKEVFLDFADAFQRHKGSPEIMAAGMQIFGRSFQTLIPLLQQGREGLAAMAEESDRLGFTLSQEAGEQAEAFNDNLQRMRTQLGGVVQDIASGMLPTLLALTDQTAKAGERTEAFTDLGRGLAQVLVVAANAVDVIARATRSLAMIFAEAAQQGGRLLTIGKSLASGNFKGALAGMAGWAGGSKNLLGDLSSEWSKSYLSYVEKMPELPEKPKPPEIPGTGGGKGGRGRAAPAGKSEAEREAERLQSAYESLNKRMKEQIALFGDTTEAAKVRYDLEHGALKALDQGLKDQLIGYAEQLDMMREEKELQAELDRINRQKEEAFNRVNDEILKQIDLLGLTREQQELALALAWAGVDAESERGREIARNVALRQDLERQLDREIDLMDSIRDASRGFLTDLAQGKNIWDSLGDAVKRFADMLTEIAAQEIIKQLFGGQGEKAGGSAGGWIGSIIGAFFGAKAGGGDVLENRGYWVGEQGPEWFQPRTAGTIIPTDRALGGHGGVQMTNNYSFSAPTSTKTQTQMAARTSFELSRAQRLQA